MRKKIASITAQAEIVAEVLCLLGTIVKSHIATSQIAQLAACSIHRDRTMLNEKQKQNKSHSDTHTHKHNPIEASRKKLVQKPLLWQ